MSKRRIEETGNKYGKWTVLSFGGHTTARTALWNVQCDCGNVSKVTGTNLRKGISTQCMSCRARMTGARDKHREDLYMIRSGDYIKIGSTDDIDRRLKHMECDNPHEIKVIGHWPGWGYMEHQLHEKLKEHRHRGEWFHAHLRCPL